MSDSYPFLVDLITRLKQDGNDSDAKICEMALYVLQKQDKKIRDLQNKTDALQKRVAHIDTMKEGIRPYLYPFDGSKYQVPKEMHTRLEILEKKFAALGFKK